MCTKLMEDNEESSILADIIDILIDKAEDEKKKKKKKK